MGVYDAYCEQANILDEHKELLREAMQNTLSFQSFSVGYFMKIAFDAFCNDLHSIMKGIVKWPM